MTEAEDAARRRRRGPAGAAEGPRGDRGRAARPRFRPAARRGDRVADPPFAVGHWVPEQVRLAGGWELLGAGGRAVRRDDLGGGRRGRPRGARADAVRVRRSPRRSPSGPGRRGPTGWGDLRAVREERVFVVDGRGVLAAGAAGHRRDRDARRADRPGRVRRDVAARQLGARRYAVTASTPSAVPRHLRLPVVRDRRGRRAAPDDLEGWAQLCPTCLGKAGVERVPARPAAAAIEARGPAVDAAGEPPVDRRRGAPRRPSVAARGRHPPGTPSAAAPRCRARAAPTFPDDWFLRRGEFARGAIHDTAWNAELDVVTRWLDGRRWPAGSRSPRRASGSSRRCSPGKGELHAERPGRRRARSRARPARRPRPAGPHPRGGPVGRRRRAGEPGADAPARRVPARPGPRRGPRHGRGLLSAPGSGPAAAWPRSSSSPTRPAARRGHRVDLARPGRGRGGAPAGGLPRHRARAPPAGSSARRRRAAEGLEPP